MNSGELRATPGGDDTQVSESMASSDVVAEQVGPATTAGIGKEDDNKKMPKDEKKEQEVGEKDEEEEEGEEDDSDLEESSDEELFAEEESDDGEHDVLVVPANPNPSDRRRWVAAKRDLRLYRYRQELRNRSPELPSSVTTLRVERDGREGIVYVVGTAHFSEVSNKEVTELIKTVMPDRVVVELDVSRIHVLRLDETRLMDEVKAYDFAMFRRLAQQQGFTHGLMHYLLLRMSASLVEQLGMAPGGEFRAADKARCQVPGCTLALGDRPVYLTLHRAFRQLSYFARLRLAMTLLTNFGPITREDVERSKDSDFLESLLKELGTQFPILCHVFVDERDRYLARSIYDYVLDPMLHEEFLLRRQPPEPVVCVAVVGMGHVAGIARYWDSAASIDREELSQTLRPTRSETLLKRGLKWAALGGLIYGGYCLLTRLAARFW